MEKGTEHEPEPPSPFDRCLERMTWLTDLYGRPMRYVPDTGILRPAVAADQMHALMKLGAVDVEDIASTYEEPAPIMYEVAVFTEEGRAVSQYVALLTQGVEALNRRVEYRFRLDKTVLRHIDELGGAYDDVLASDELELLAQQLETLHPYGS